MNRSILFVFGILIFPALANAQNKTQDIGIYYALQKEILEPPRAPVSQYYDYLRDPFEGM